MPDLRSIFRDIDRIDWRRLVHAYGRAEDVPAMLWHAVSENAEERDRGWDGIWGSLNHQGDFYDSTVATIPYFIRFLTCEEVPYREKFLSYLYDRYLDAANYGGDPLLDDPPGGDDIPTPMIIDGSAQGAAEDLEEPDSENARRMDLCAWQTGRAIRAGLPVYESLLNHSNKEIAGNAADLLNELTMQVSDNTGLSAESWRTLLEHSNWLVRFEAASTLASVGGALRDSEDSARGLRESIRPLLRDETFDEVSISGEYKYKDQIYQWRRQRRSVAGAAVRAIFSLGLTFESDDLLDAMLREAMQSLVRCGDIVVVSEYSATEWRLACESASGGLVKGEMRVRTARQRCHQLLWSGGTYDPLLAVAERNLQEAILRLSGRLVPHDEL